MTKRHTTIASALLIAVLLTAAGCGGGKHQAGNSTSTTSAPATTADSPTTSTTSTSGPGGNTTTTILGPSGPASSYPAAQATPPSLAGAYPSGNAVNLVTVLKTLTTYRDWVWSHPNPALVSNYELSSGNDYATDVKDLTDFQQQGLHASPTPSEIDSVRVIQPPRDEPAVGGSPARIDGYQWFFGGIVEAVDNVEPVPLLRANGTSSGEQFNPTSVGHITYYVSLVQGPDGQFRFEQTTQISPAGESAGQS